MKGWEASTLIETIRKSQLQSQVQWLILTLFNKPNRVGASHPFTWWFNFWNIVFFKISQDGQSLKTQSFQIQHLLGLRPYSENTTNLSIFCSLSSLRTCIVLKQCLFMICIGAYACVEFHINEILYVCSVASLTYFDAVIHTFLSLF
jgi:hypothetical protein